MYKFFYIINTFIICLYYGHITLRKIVTHVNPYLIPNSQEMVSLDTK